jgi:hypothetical protein
MAKESIRRQVRREFKIAQYYTGQKNQALNNLDAIEESSESEGDDLVSQREDFLENYYQTIDEEN